ncbi:MAG: peptide deformylase [Bacteroidales bacterium]|nr:peptide deformylase [Bacteroidales bacterium]
MKRILFPIIIVFIILLSGCCKKTTFTKEEKTLIGSDITAGIMHLYTIEDKNELKLLRLTAAELSQNDIKSEIYLTLKQRMLDTVLDSLNEGIGIAAPQVGISKKLVAVQRFDKEGEPFEFYPNAEIEYYAPEYKFGMEGCLSVPNRKDSVNRSKMIVVRYNDEKTFNKCHDTISGFTAVIFQHETDHLKGILYTDYK